MGLATAERDKIQAQKLEGKIRFSTRRYPTGDVQLTSLTRTELTPFEERVSSSVIFSPLGRLIIRQNPDILRRIFEDSYPREKTPEGSPLENIGCMSSTRLIKVPVNNKDRFFVVKQHDEGHSCYSHYFEGVLTTAYKDAESGIVSFHVNREINEHLDPESNIFVPEPVFGTERLYMTEYISGYFVKQGEIPRQAQRAVKKPLMKPIKENSLRGLISGLDLSLKVTKLILKLGGMF